MSAVTNKPAIKSDWRNPVGKLECDLVMKGGITSGVIYPRAIAEFAKSYRLRCIGGASAGAIGAALAAAAEYGRTSAGGFELLDRLPRELDDGKLGRMFQPQKFTKALLPAMLAIAEGTPEGARAHKVRNIVCALFRSFPLASLLSILPGVALLVLGILYEISVKRGSSHTGIAAGLAFVIGGSVLVMLLGLVITLAARVIGKLIRAVPQNDFGICTGIQEGGTEPGFTDWLSDRIDAVAGLAKNTKPLTFGQLYRGPDLPDSEPVPAEHYIELSMMTTSLSLSRAFQFPANHRNLFYDETTWRRLFPGYVVDALVEASNWERDAGDRDQQIGVSRRPCGRESHAAPPETPER